MAKKNIKNVKDSEQQETKTAFSKCETETNKLKTATKNLESVVSSIWRIVDAGDVIKTDTIDRLITNVKELVNANNAQKLGSII